MVMDSLAIVMGGAADCNYEAFVLDDDQDAATDLLPRLRRVEALLKRWLSGTGRGAVHCGCLDVYLYEFTFRFNRRDTLSRGEFFHQLLQQAVQTDPVTYRSVVAAAATNP